MVSPYYKLIVHYAILTAVLLIGLPLANIGIEVTPLSAMAIFAILFVMDLLMHKVWHLG